MAPSTRLSSQAATPWPPLRAPRPRPPPCSIAPRRGRPADGGARLGARVPAGGRGGFRRRNADRASGRELDVATLGALPRGRRPSADLAARLTPLGHRVATAIVYDAFKAERFSAPARRALEQGEVGAVLHFSARTAEAFLSCLGAENGFGAENALARDPPRHLCLSARVAATLRAAGTERVEVAAYPEEGALLAMLGG